MDLHPFYAIEGSETDSEGVMEEEEIYEEEGLNLVLRPSSSYISSSSRNQQER